MAALGMNSDSLPPRFALVRASNLARRKEPHLEDLKWTDSYAVLFAVAAVAINNRNDVAGFRLAGTWTIRHTNEMLVTSPMQARQQSCLL
ncbi:hypothetical protein C7378_3331 [Acidipila rosea]|uniref:Uncharacterized protein n=1 Tax=Acidipila rosea TaxID=768535 RepID=A0A4R1KXM1_9BACT|nr:hypothetical protein C7378_3331 [Acidipila rosea]